MSVDYSAKLLVGYEVDCEYYNRNIDKEDGDEYLCSSNAYGTSQFFFGKILDIVGVGEGCEVSTDLAEYTRICEEVMTDFMFEAPENILKSKKVLLKITKADVVKATEKKYRKVA